VKNKTYISIVLVSLFMATTYTSKAAFPVKRDAAKTESIKLADQPAEATTSIPASAATALNLASATETKTAAKKHSFFSRIFNKIEKVKEAAIPKIAYIILAIVGLGWLGMGLNDNFEGFDWILSLILYLIFYFPGLIYTLIMMGNYY
jgi:hypothetical protein